MFPKRLYVAQFEDDSLVEWNSEQELLESAENDDAFAVYQLVGVGHVEESKRIVIDKPKRGRPRKS